MVNGALRRSLEYSMYSLGRLLKASFGIFKRQTLGHILGQTQAKKPLGPAASQLFGLWSGLRFAFRKSLAGPSILSLGSILSTHGNLLRGSIHHATSSPFPQIVPLLSQGTKVWKLILSVCLNINTPLLSEDLFRRTFVLFVFLIKIGQTVL